MKSLKECVLLSLATPLDTVGMGSVDADNMAIPINGKARKLKKTKKKKKVSKKE